MQIFAPSWTSRGWCACAGGSEEHCMLMECFPFTTSPFHSELMRTGVMCDLLDMRGGHRHIWQVAMAQLPHQALQPLGRSSLLTAEALQCCTRGSLAKTTRSWGSITRNNSQTSAAATVAAEELETSKTSVSAGEWVQLCGYVIRYHGVRWEDTGIDPAQKSWGARSRCVALAPCSDISHLKEYMTRSKIFAWSQFSQAISSDQQLEPTGTLFFRTPNLFWLPTICILKAFKHYLWYHSLI